jgi:hypothetical protein
LARERRSGRRRRCGAVEDGEVARDVGLFAASCEKHASDAAVHEKTMYALKDGVAFRAGSSAVVKSLRYGESVRIQGCESATCASLVDNSLATALASELTDQQPPVGSRYVWGHYAQLKPNQKVTIQAYNPSTNSFEVDGGVSVPAASLGKRPETAAETKTREKAEAIAQEARQKVDTIARAARHKADAIAKAAEAKQRREDVRQERERLQVVLIEGEKDRRAFAGQLRENYLATGADIKVSVSGSHAERLKLEYPLFNDVWLYQFQHNGVIEVLKAKGFTHLILSDGWNYAMRLTLN